MRSFYHMALAIFAFVLATVGIGNGSIAWAQAPTSPPNILSVLDPADSGRVAYLRERGFREERNSVVVWFPPDAMPQPQRQALAEELNRGVSALRTLVGSHPWQRISSQKIVLPQS